MHVESFKDIDVPLSAPIAHDESAWIVYDVASFSERTADNDDPGMAKHCPRVIVAHVELCSAHDDVADGYEHTCTVNTSSLAHWCGQLGKKQRT